MPYANAETRRQYHRAYWQANKDRYLARNAGRREQWRLEARTIIRQAKDVPCTDCGVRYPYYVMHFDHTRDDKEFNIGGYVAQGGSRRRLLAEIAKCEVVCANCHAERTHQRLAPETGLEPVCT